MKFIDNMNKGNIKFRYIVLPCLWLLPILFIVNQNFYALVIYTFIFAGFFLPVIEFVEYKDIFSPLCIFPFIYTILFLPGMVIVRDIENKMCISLTVGLLAFCCGILLPRFLLKLKFNSSNKLRMRISSIFMAGIIFILISLVAHLIIIGALGVPILSGRLKLLKISGYLVGLAGLYFPGVCLLYIYLLKIKFKKKLSRFVLYVEFFIFIIPFLLLTALSGWRSPIFAVLLGIVFIRHYFYKKLNLWQLLLWFIILSLVSAGITGIREKSNFWAGIRRTFLGESVALVSTLKLVFKNFNNNDKFLKGKALLMGFEILKPGHQDDLSMYLKKRFALKFKGGGIPPTIIGGFYIDFGLKGVIIGMFLLGFFVQLLYFKLFSVASEMYKFVYVYTLIYVMLSFRNHIFANTTATLTWILFGMLAYVFYIDATIHLHLRRDSYVSYFL